MYMTKGEILKMYKERPNSKRIQEIAELNGCKANDVRQVLRECGEDIAVFEKKKPGRPPKAKEEESTNKIIKEMEEVLKDKKEKEEIKSESLLPNKPVETMHIPQAVIDMCKERIQSLNRQIDMHCETINKLNVEREELREFIALGENKSDEENGVHREI